MARQREFDKQAVLERAMMLFWSRGYEATSVRDLNAAMGISSSSMYETFGDKRDVFLAVLERYCAIEQALILQMAQEAVTPAAFIMTLFGRLNIVVQEAGYAGGSLALNAMVEFGTRDPDVTKHLLDHYLKIVDIIADVLADAQASGTVSSRLPPQALAHTLLSALQGSATLKGVKPDFTFHNDVAKVLITLLHS